MTIGLPSGKSATTPQMQRQLRAMEKALPAVNWLCALDIPILEVSIKPSGGVITVACQPILSRLFASDCAWRQRRRVGESTVYTWFSVRYGTRIEWEEVAPCLA